MLGVTIAMDWVAILPAGLIGVLTLEIGTTVDVAPATLGVVISAYFLSGSATAALLGSQIDRAGPRRSASIAGVVSVACLAAMAAPWDSFWPVAVIAAAAGSAMAIMMPSTNAMLGSVVPQRFRMLAVCAKQAAVPIALASAAATIAIATSLGGWRSVFAGAAALGCGVLVCFRRCTTKPNSGSAGQPSAHGGSGRAAQRTILRVGASTMLASLLAGSLTGYAAISLRAAGFSPVGVATVLALSNAAGVLSRLISGWWAQRRRSTSLRAVAAMMLAGSVGAALLAAGTPVTAAIGSVVAFGLGWGFSALTYAVILELNPDNPGATGSVIQSGGMAGSGLGPLIMAGVAGYSGLAAGWLVVAAASVAAGLLIWRFQPAR